MPEDISTLGFQFTHGDSVQKISKLIDSLDKLENAASRVKPSVEKLFSADFVNRVNEVGNVFQNLHGGFANAASAIAELRKSIVPIANRLKKLSDIKPIRQDTLSSFERLADSVRTISTAVNGRMATPKISVPNATGISASGINSVRSMNGEMKKLNNHTDAFYSKVNRIAQSGAWAMVFRQSFDEAVKFGIELAHINSLSMEYNPEKLRSGLLNISSEFGRAAKLAEAEYYAYSSGVRGTEADLTNFTAQMAKTSTLIRANIIPTVDAATSAMNAYGISAKNASEISDLMYMIVKQGKAKGEQLASGLGQVISTSATAGLSLDEMGASVASLTKVMQTRNAITYFNNMLSKMLKPTKESRLAAQALGIELGLDAIRASGFANKMQEIHDKTKGSQEALLRIFPDLRGQRAALQLLNKGWGDFQYQLKAFAGKTGAADEAMKMLSEDVNFQLSKIPDTFNKIKVATGTFLTEFFTVGGALSPGISAFNNMSETTQKVIGAMLSLAGVYTMVKGGMVAYQAMQALQIRNSREIAAAKAQEAAASMAIVNAMNAETTARSSNATASAVSSSANVAKRIALYKDAMRWNNGNPAAEKMLRNLQANALAMQNVSGLDSLRRIAAQKSEKAVSASFLLNDVRETAKLVGTRQEINRLKAVESAFIAADTAAMKAQRDLLAYEYMLRKKNTAELTTQSALQKTMMSFTGVQSGGNVFSALSSGNGFWGGMGRGGIKGLNDWKSFLKYQSMAMNAGKAANVLSRSIAVMGAGIGKVAWIALTVFSPLNIMIGGGVAVLLGAADLLLNDGKVIKSVGEKIYNFFTGAFDEIENVKKRMDAINKYDAFRMDVSGFATSMTDWANGLNGRNVPQDISELAKFQKARQDALAKLDAADMKVRKSEYVATIMEADALRKNIGNGFNLSRAVDEANKKFNSQVKIGQGNNLIARKTVVASPDVAYAMDNADDLQAIKYIESRKKAIDEDVKKLGELENKARAQQEVIQRAQEAFKQPSEAIVKFWQKNIEAASSIMSMLKQQKFSMLSPEEQNNRRVADIGAYEAQFYKAQSVQNAGIMQSSVENMLKAHNTAIDYAKKQIESGKRLVENLEDDLYEVDSKLFGSSQYGASKRANEILKNAGVSFDAGSYNFGNDLEKSYTAVKKSFQIQIAEQQKQVENARNLANAERQANDNTVKLIQSMDKYKSTAMDAVQANSVDALKLQSRSFSAVPKFNLVSTSFQRNETAEDSSLKNLYESMQDALEQLKNAAQSRTQGAQEQKDTLENRMTEFIAKQEEALKRVMEQAQANKEKVADDAKRQDEVFHAIADSSRQTADATKRTADVLSNIEVVTM